MTHGMTEEAPPGPLAFVVIGASGDLAQNKILPALFALYSQDLLPRDLSSLALRGVR